MSFQCGVEFMWAPGPSIYNWLLVLASVGRVRSAQLLLVGKNRSNENGLVSGATGPPGEYSLDTTQDWTAFSPFRYTPLALGLRLRFTCLSFQLEFQIVARNGFISILGWRLVGHLPSDGESIIDAFLLVQSFHPITLSGVKCDGR